MKIVPHEVATRMMNAVGFDSQNWRLRDKITMAIADEVERMNKEREKEAKREG